MNQDPSRHDPTRLPADIGPYRDAVIGEILRLLLQIDPQGFTAIYAVVKAEGTAWRKRHQQHLRDYPY